WHPLPCEARGKRPNGDAYDAVALRLVAIAAGGCAARTVHALPDARHAVAQLPVDAERGAAGGLRRARQLFAARRRPHLLAGTVEQPVVRGLHHPVVDRTRVADGGVGQRQDRRPRLPATRLLHSDRAADDRGGEYLAVLLYAGVRSARKAHWRAWVTDAQ